KGAHVKRGLRRPVLVSVADRAGASRAASAVEAVAAVRAAKMTGAGVDVVPLGAEGSDGTGGQTRFRKAAIARVAAVDGRRNRPACSYGERAAVAVPEAPLRMDQHAERRPVDRLRLQRPALERQPGWAV